MPTPSDEMERWVSTKSAESHTTERWAVVPAFSGRGALLVGPRKGDDGESLGGAVALAPPGTFLRTPEGAAANDGHERGLTREGWRVAWWAPGVRLDQHRPIGTRSLTLGEAVQYIRLRTPGHLCWIRDVVREQLMALVGFTKRDRHGRLPPQAARACRQAYTLAGAAAECFGDEYELMVLARELKTDQQSLKLEAELLARA